MSGEPQPERVVEDWAARFEQAGLAGRAALLGGGAVRLAARLAERALDRAATVVVEAQDAFKKELDPNVSDACVIEDVRERRPPPPAG